MPNPKPNPRPDPQQSRRLAAVRAAPLPAPQPIPAAQARRLLSRLAEQAERDGDAEAAKRHRATIDKLAPGFEFEVFLRYQVDGSLT